MQNALPLSRRSLIKLGSAALIGLAVSPLAPELAEALPSFSGCKALSFRNLHTDEKLSVTYWKNGSYNRQAMAQINAILRDHRSNEIFPISVRLIDLVHEIRERIHDDSPVEIISGYRSPQTNASLASHSDGVARHSYHMKGMALDLRLKGTSLRKLQNQALLMRRGGVGYYPSSGFVHIDVGPLRRW